MFRRIDKLPTARDIRVETRQFMRPKAHVIRGERLQFATPSRRGGDRLSHEEGDTPLIHEPMLERLT